MGLLGWVRLNDPNGIVVELPVYADNLDLANDFSGGNVHAGDRIMYRDMVCEIVGDHTDDDGMVYTELLQMDMIGYGATVDIRI